MSIKKKWKRIPHHRLGHIPERTTDRMRRLIIAKRAVLAGYEDSDDPDQCIVDLLTDLHHLADDLGLSFHSLDRTAYHHYISEKFGEDIALQTCPLNT